jgi:CDP-diacylglycerol--glycerol-3-phosphate 3-phosphatidyltransferase
MIENPKPHPEPGPSSPGAPPGVPFDELTFNTTPNQLTLLRIAFVPVVVGLLFLKEPKWDLLAALAFTVASITDYFDGYLARAYQVVTVYGKLLDPLADKFLVVTSLIMLQALGRIHPVVVMLLICREMAITGLRALASAEGLIIGASNSAKWKTGTQMVAIPLIMVGSAIFELPLYPIGMGLLYISLAISLWSAQDYVVDFFRAIQEQRKHKQHERRNIRKARLAARSARIAAKAARAADTQASGQPDGAPSSGAGPGS